MGLRIAFLGAGAIGAPAALLVARAMGNARITVLDAGLRLPASRTFALLCGVVERFKDANSWDLLEGVAHRINKVTCNFEEFFGALSLGGEDCDSDYIAMSLAEDAMLNSIQGALKKHENISYLDGAKVSKITPDGEVGFVDPDGNDRSETFDLVVVSGLPDGLLKEAGFVFSIKAYEHKALVSTYSCEKTSDVSHERFLPDGAATLVPRKDGYGHILITAGTDIDINSMDGDEYHRLLIEKKWAAPDAKASIVGKGGFMPRMRTADNPGQGRVLLLGASACSVHPIGAQELNLGLRDALELSEMLPGTKADKMNLLVSNFCQRRKKDRQRIARLTDMAATFSTTRFPGKLLGAGIGFTAIDICPMARRFFLGTVILP